MGEQEISEETKAAWTALWEYASNCIDRNDGTIDFKTFMEYGMKEFNVKQIADSEPALQRSNTRLFLPGDSFITQH